MAQKTRLGQGHLTPAAVSGSESPLLSSAGNGTLALAKAAALQRPEKRFRLGVVRGVDADAVFGLLLVLSMQTIYMKMTNRYVGLALLALLAVVGLRLVVRETMSVARSAIALIVLWTLFFTTIPLSQFIILPAGRMNVGATLEVSVMFTVVFPICLAYVFSKGIRPLLRSISDAVLLVTALTLPLYFLGQVLHVLQPTNVVDITWGGLRSVSSYFGLLFTPQGLSPYHGFANGRYTGIFTEAPMCAFMLCFSLIFTLFLDDRKTRWPKLLVIAVALYCTVSTTGYVVGLVAASLYVAAKAWDAEKGHLLAAPVMLLALMSMVLFAIVASGGDLLSLDARSAAIRSNNFQGALSDFSQSMLIGKGFKSDAAGVTGGTTSVFSQVFQQGGALFALWYFFPFANGLFSLCRARQWRLLVAGLLYLVLLYPTVVTYTPLSIAMVAVFCAIPQQIRSRREDIQDQLVPDVSLRRQDNSAIPQVAYKAAGGQEQGSGKLSGCTTQSNPAHVVCPHGRGQA